VRRKLKGNTLILTVQTFAPGRLIAKGKNLKTASRRVRKASTTTLKLKLSRAGLNAVRAHRRLKLRVKVRFLPSHKGEPGSSASTTIKLRR
jgi:hypothetical protein